MLGTVSKLPLFVSQFVLEFYANLSKEIGDPNSKRNIVRGHTFQFSPSIINQCWECDDVPEKKVEISATDPMVSVITGGKVRTWPPRYNIRASHLTSRYYILYKMAMCN